MTGRWRRMASARPPAPCDRALDVEFDEIRQRDPLRGHEIVEPAGFDVDRRDACVQVSFLKSRWA